MFQQERMQCLSHDPEPLQLLVDLNAIVKIVRELECLV